MGVAYIAVVVNKGHHWPWKRALSIKPTSGMHEEWQKTSREPI